MGRLILGIAAGLVAAFATIFGIDLAGHQIYPLPSDLNMDDYQAVGDFVSAMPAGAVAFVLLAWFLGAVDGGVVAAAISRRAWTVWAVAAVVAAAAIASVLIIPHPVIQQIGVVAAALLGGLVASLVAGKILRHAD